LLDENCDVMAPAPPDKSSDPVRTPESRDTSAWLYYWLPPILWGLAIIGMSGDIGSSTHTFGLMKWLLSWFGPISQSQVDLINFLVRKTGHATAYGLMYFLWFRALRGHQGVSPGRACLAALGLSLLVSMTDEGRQSFTNTRGGSIYDVLLDLSGASLTALLTFAVWSPRPKALYASRTGVDHAGRPE
jgi:VanZ family protein